MNGFFCLTVLLGSALGLVPQPPAPLLLEPAQINLGPVKSGQIFERRVQVLNRSPHPIDIHEIRTSCGCLQPRLHPRRLEPGAAATLDLRINSLTNAPGPQAWRAVLRGASAAGPVEAELTVLAEVLQELTLTPASLTLYLGERPVQTQLRLTDHRSRPLKVRGVSSSIPQITLDLEATTVQPIMINVTITPSLPVGRHDAQIEITTDDPEYPTLLVPVTINKRASQRWLTTPVELRFDASTGRQRRLTVRDSRGQPVSLGRIEATIPGVTAQVQPPTAAAATVLVTITPMATLREGELLLYVEGETAPLRVPIRVAPDERP